MTARERAEKIGMYPRGIAEIEAEILAAERDAAAAERECCALEVEHHAMWFNRPHLCDGLAARLRNPGQRMAGLS